MFDGPEPIYIQIADQITGDILAGRLNAGDQVMSTTQYATTYRINPATAAKAFTNLVTDGVLYKQRGVGMFVAEGAPERLRAQRRESFFAQQLDPVLQDAMWLGISTTDIQNYISNKGGAR